jgi:hypothetical protein
MGFLSCGFHYVNTKLDELKVHSHLVLKDSSIKSPSNTSSQPGRDLSCNCRWQNSVGLNSLKSHGHPLPITYTIYMYVCMYVYMYNIHMCMHLQSSFFIMSIQQ